MKTFDDLIFQEHELAISAKRVIERDPSLKDGYLGKLLNAKHAVINFDNGYGISVLFGTSFYSNGINTYESAALCNGVLCYDTPITDDVMGFLKKEEVSDMMKKIQELKAVI